MNVHIKNCFLVAVSILLLGACGGGGSYSLETTDSGLKFNFFSQSDTGSQIAAGTLIDYHIKVTNITTDSVLENTYEKNPFRNFQFPPDTTKGDFSEAMLMMSEGDSAVFVVTSDTIRNIRTRAYDQAIVQLKSRAQASMAQAPSDSVRQMIQTQVNQQVTNYTMQKNSFLKNFPEGQEIEYLIKVLKVRTEEEIRLEQEELIAKEDQEIIKYLDKKNLEGEKTESGLYIVTREEGDGPKPEMGDQVLVDYVGQLLDGSVFDTSIKQVAIDHQKYNAQRTYQPLNFTLGSRSVIPGWEEGISLINKGTKATFVIPSRLAYGSVANGDLIPANSILVFDIDLVDVIKKN